MAGEKTTLHATVHDAVLDAIRSPDVQLALTSAAEAAAKTALRDQFMKFGVDTEKPQQLYADLSALRSWVAMRNTAKSTIVKSITASLVGGLILLVVLGLQDWFRDLVKHIR